MDRHCHSVNSRIDVFVGETTKSWGIPLDCERAFIIESSTPNHIERKPRCDAAVSSLRDLLDALHCQVPSESPTLLFRIAVPGHHHGKLPCSARPILLGCQRSVRETAGSWLTERRSLIADGSHRFVAWRWLRMKLIRRGKSSACHSSDTFTCLQTFPVA